MIVVSPAAARVVPTLTSSLTDGRTDIPVMTDDITTFETPSTKLGAHADFNVDFDLNYGGTGLTPGGEEDPDTYPPGSDWRETLKDVVVEIPPGLVGNPNSIPLAERCDPVVFETAECPDTSTVGEIWLKYSLMFESSGNASALSIIPIGPDWRDNFNQPASGWTRVSLIRTEPEVPARIGIYIRGPINFGPVRVMLEINPVTTEDLRLRAATVGGIPDQIYNGNQDDWEQYRLERMRIKLYGKLPNGRSFMTNPTSCEPWTTRAWAKAHYVNDNVDGNPYGGAPEYKQSNDSTIQPDCSNAASVPFPASGTVSISTNKRDVAPDFDFNIENPGMYNDTQVSSGPKKIVTRVPAAINVDVLQLGRICAREDFFADRCPASTRVGSARIETPLLSAGLTGDSYLVKAVAGSGGLPDLGLRVRGPITFTQLSTNRYVGVRGNEIETTFDNIPQLGFTKLNFHLDGGPNGLLRTLACPTDNREPSAGKFTYNFTSWTGATTSSTTNLNGANCFGVQKLPRFGCVANTFRVSPTYTSRSRVRRAELRINNKRVKTAKQNKAGTAKFNFKYSTKKLKPRKKYKYEVRAIYDDGTVSKKKSTFRKCK